MAFLSGGESSRGQTESLVAIWQGSSSAGELWVQGTIHPHPAHRNILVFCFQTQPSTSPVVQEPWEEKCCSSCSAATPCSSQINPNLRLCKVPGAESAILTKGRKTEAFNHQTVATFPVVWGQDETSW